MHPLTATFVIALVLHLLVQVWLAARQIRHVGARRSQVPAAFAGDVSPADHQKAADYTLAKERLGIVETLYDAVVLLWLTLGGGIGWIAGVVSRVGLTGLPGEVAHVLTILGILSVLGLPFGAYRTFQLERRFGFNRTTPRIFAVDRLKGWVLGGVIGGAVVAVVLWIMGIAGPAWWLVAWCTWLAFSLLAAWAWPRLIAPIFNTFTPLGDAALRDRIDALLARCGFRASGVFVMDGSRRSAHGNAYFTGLGRTKRIVFFDTLLGSLTPPQVESVLAHELGHFRLHHVPKRLLAGAAMSLAGFAVLGWLSRQDAFYTALGVDQPGNSAALILFSLVVPTFTWVLSPVLAAWSRKHEFEADGFAALHSDGEELARALVSMYRENASTLTPDPFHSAFYDSHPPPVARIARLTATPGTARPTAVTPVTAT